MKALKQAMTVLLSVVLWGIILLTALFTFTTLATRDDQSVARIAGFTPLIVQSESMNPTFAAGDLIIIRSCDPDELVVGDIVTFHTIIENQYALNTHRIAEIHSDNGFRSYVTKGDNNAIVDTHIIANGDIVGLYICNVPVLGKVMGFLSSSVGFLLVIVLPMLLFFVYQIYHLVMVSINLKKALAVEAATEAAKLEDDTAAAKLAEAEAALAEAKRMKEEMEAQLASMKEANNNNSANENTVSENTSSENTSEEA